MNKQAPPDIGILKGLVVLSGIFAAFGAFIAISALGGMLSGSTGVSGFSGVIVAFGLLMMTFGIVSILIQNNKVKRAKK